LRIKRLVLIANANVNMLKEQNFSLTITRVLRQSGLTVVVSQLVPGLHKEIVKIDVLPMRSSLGKRTYLKK